MIYIIFYNGSCTGPTSTGVDLNSLEGFEVVIIAKLYLSNYLKYWCKNWD
jgi:hypothetical protein